MQLTFSAGVSMLPSPAGLHDESVAHPSVGNGVDADVHAAGGWRKHSKPAGREWQIQDLLLLMLLTAAVRLPWIFMIPISEAPDEGAHLWVINFIYTHWRLPLPADMIANPAAAYYGALSPLGYLPHLTCAVLMPWFNCALAFRFGSLLMGVGAVAASYFIGHELFKRSRLLALAPPLYMVFHPQFVFVNAYSNNDSATCFIASLVIYACLVGVRRGVSQRSALVTGFLCGLLALCKPTSYCLFPVLVFSICFAVWLHERNGKNRLDLLKLFSLRLSTMLSAALLVSMPFFLKNILQFNGDLLGMRIMLDLWWQAYGKPEPLYHWPVINDRNWQYCLLISYFGNFGNMTRLMPSRIYKYYTLALNLSMFGWLVAPFAAQALSFASSHFIRTRSYAFEQAARLTQRYQSMCSAIALKENYSLWLVLFLCVALNFAAVIAGSTSLNSTGPPQGKYLFPAEAAIATLLIGGLSRLGGRYIVALFLLFNTIACAISFSMLSGIYHFDTNIFR